MVADKAKGPVELMIQSKSDANLKITIVDADRDQVPDSLKIVKTVDGKPTALDVVLACICFGLDCPM